MTSGATGSENGSVDEESKDWDRLHKKGNLKN